METNRLQQYWFKKIAKRLKRLISINLFKRLIKLISKSEIFKVTNSTLTFKNNVYFMGTYCSI